jgi:hypothetical protein
MLEDGRWRAQQHRLRTAVLVGIWGIFACVLLAAAYTGGTLAYLRSRGVYPSAEAGMWALIERGYRNPELVEIIYAGTNSFDGSDPNVWYVIACVWGGERADGAPVGNQQHSYDQPGSFFLATPDGWVHAPEGVFPQLLGIMMRITDLAGAGDATPTHDWGSGPQHCEF